MIILYDIGKCLLDGCRNNRIHGISILKRTLQHVSDLETESEVTWKLIYLRTHLGVSEHGDRVGFPAKNFPKERAFCLFRVNRIPFILFMHSAIGSRMNGMIFRSFRKRNSSQKNTNTVYSEYSYSRIVPKERALYKRFSQTFSSSSLIISVNFLHSYSFVFGLFLTLRGLSTRAQLIRL